MVNWTGIGVGAQSTLGGKTFLLEKYVIKILKKCRNFTVPLALKIIKISESLCYLPDKVTIFLNLTRFLPEKCPNFM